MAYNYRRVKSRLEQLFSHAELSDASQRMNFGGSGTKSKFASELTKFSQSFEYQVDFLRTAFTSSSLKGALLRWGLPVPTLKDERAEVLAVVLDDATPWGEVRERLERGEYYIEQLHNEDEELNPELSEFQFRVAERMSDVFSRSQLKQACERLNLSYRGTGEELARRLAADVRSVADVEKVISDGFLVPALKENRNIWEFRFGRLKEDLVEGYSNLLTDPDDWDRVRELWIYGAGDTEWDRYVQRYAPRFEDIFVWHQLSEACTEFGLPRSGKKSVLAARIAELAYDLGGAHQILETTFRASDIKELCIDLELETGKYKSDNIEAILSVLDDPREWEVVCCERLGWELEESDDDGGIIDSCEVAGRSRWEINNDTLHLAAPGLLEHQFNALTKLEDWWESNDTQRQNGVVVLPTGAGKTRLAVTFALRAVVAQGGRVLWLAPRTELVQGALQTFITCGGEALRSFVLSRFERQERRDDEPGDVVVASLPTIAYAPQADFPNVDELLNSWSVSGPCLVVFDECHHMGAKSWTKAIMKLVDRLRKEEDVVRLVGLSATPTRTESKQLPAFWRNLGGVIYELGMSHLIERRILARPDFRFEDVDDLQVEADASDRKFFEQFNDLSAQLVKAIVLDEKFNRAVVNRYLESADEFGQVLVFAARKDHAHHLATLFRKAGVKCEVLISGFEMDVNTRRAILERFAGKEYPVLINVAICTEGVDIPKLDTVFIARPTRSRVLTQQMVGRSMRGPAVGGTEQCKVVVFHAEVVGLIGEVLHSSYTDEAEMYGELNMDIEAIENAEQTAESTVGTLLPMSQDQDEQDDSATLVDAEVMQEFQERLAELERTVQQVDLDTVTLRSLLPNNLVGWYEAGTGNETTPVFAFEENKDALDGELERLSGLAARSITSNEAYELANESQCRVSSLRWVDPERWHFFAQVVLLTEGRYIFHAFENATPTDLERLRDLVGGGDESKTQPMTASDLPSSETSSARVSDTVVSISPVHDVKPTAESVPPSWIAQARAQHATVKNPAAAALVKGEMVLVFIDDSDPCRTLLLREPDWIELNSLWQDVNRKSPPGAVDTERGVATLKDYLISIDVKEETAHQVATTVATTGQLPVATRYVSNPPELPVVATEFFALDKGEREFALDSLYETWYRQEYESRESFLTGLLIVAPKT